MSNKDTVLVDYSTKVLEVKNLKKHFLVGSGKNKLVVPAVDGVTFDVYKKEVFGLVGESGCGKTTTGRTIIKLYTPTDGSAIVDGLPIASGYNSNLAEIKKIKKEMNLAIRALNPYYEEKSKIKEALNKDIEYYEAEKEMIAARLEPQLDEARYPMSEYNEKLYDLISNLLNDIDKLKYATANKKQDIKNAMTNPSLVEYKSRKLSLTNTFERKVEGIKESSALTKSMIEEQINQLTAQYKENLASLDKKYESLIEKDKSKLMDKAEGKAKLKELRKSFKTQMAKMKADVEELKNSLTKPSEEAIAKQIKFLTNQNKSEISKIDNKINALKAEAKAKIKSLEKTESTLSLLLKHKDEIRSIRSEANEKINKQKEIISSIKDMNKSKDSLEASRRMQMIFQDPISSLNPRMTVKEIVGEGIKLTGEFTNAEIDQKVAEVLELVGLAPEYMTRYPHEFSGGQRQRIGVARALIMDPAVIIADEPISALDVSISAQVINLLSELRERLGLTILFIAHDLSVVKFFCDRIAVMYYGKIVELAPSDELFKNPMHPYTQSLLSAIPEPDPNYEKGRKRINYNPRMHDYRIDKPTLKEINPGHQVYANDAEFEEMVKIYKSSNKQVK